MIYFRRYEYSQSKVSDVSKENELLDVPHEAYESLEKYIANGESPVRIDTQKSHI